MLFCMRRGDRDERLKDSRFPEKEDDDLIGFVKEFGRNDFYVNARNCLV